MADAVNESKQIVERLPPGAVMESVDGELKGGEATRKLFVQWLSMV